MKKAFLYSSILLVSVSCNDSPKAGEDPVAPLAKTTAMKSNAAGDCSTLCWFRKDAVMQYSMTDAAGKQTAISTTTITDVRTEGNALVAEYSTTYGNNKAIQSSYRCMGDQLYIDMKSLFNSGFGSMEKAGIEMEVKDAQLSFPWKMKEGDHLEDGTFELLTKKDGKEFMTMKNIVKDRHVEGEEKITTPAGTWNCIRLVETRVTVTSMMGRQISSKEHKTVQWFTPVAGIVKHEYYDEKGQLNSGSVLISLK